MSQSLVSIIIPTYNRAHLIGETLDSILAQTYTNWECLVIDDGSTDTTGRLMTEYKEKDNRFHYLNRSNDRLKGANACRNIGLENAKGDYVVFFDSDDLMTPDHLEVKVNAIQQSKYDYVITRTQFFNKDNSQINQYYHFDKYDITPYNYVSQKINWLTLDVCLKKELAQSVRFNEQLQSGQEYNYYCKLVYKSVNAIFVDKVVSLRRAHDESIRNQLKTKTKLNESFFRANWFTYLDIRHKAEKKTKQLLLQRASRFIMDEKGFFGQPIFKVVNVFYKEIGFKTTYLLLYLASMKLFNKGDVFRKRFKKDINL